MTPLARTWLFRALPLAVGLAATIDVLLRAKTGRGMFAHVRSLLSDEEEHPPSAPSDPLDEAIWESFPASDPPAISPRRE
jgi:hypothetical protein